MYTTPLADIFKYHGMSYISFLNADDTNIYISFHPSDTGEPELTKKRIELCIQYIKCWMSPNKLKLNNGKTEILV